MDYRWSDLAGRRLLRDLIPNAAERARPARPALTREDIDRTFDALAHHPGTDTIRAIVSEHIRSGREGPCRFCLEQAELWNNPQIAADCNVSDPPSLA